MIEVKHTHQFACRLAELYMHLSPLTENSTTQHPFRMHYNYTRDSICWQPSNVWGHTGPSKPVQLVSTTSARYSEVASRALKSKCRGLPIYSSSSSAGSAARRSTSAQSFTLLLETYSTLSFASFSRPVCFVVSSQQMCSELVLCRLRARWWWTAVQRYRKYAWSDNTVEVCI